MCWTHETTRYKAELILLNIYNNFTLSHTHRQQQMNSATCWTHAALHCKKTDEEQMRWWRCFLWGHSGWGGGGGLLTDLVSALIVVKRFSCDTQSIVIRQRQTRKADVAALSLVELQRGVSVQTSCLCLWPKQSLSNKHTSDFTGWK